MNMSVFVSLKGDLLISYFIVTLNEISASTVKPTVIFFKLLIILKLLEYLFTRKYYISLSTSQFHVQFSVLLAASF